MAVTVRLCSPGLRSLLTQAAAWVSSDLSPGEHSLTVTATDPAGLYDSARVSFTVNQLPSAPVVELSPDPALTDEDLRVSLTTPSLDPEGDTVTYSYAWYLDGVPSSAEEGTPSRYQA